MHFIHYMCSTCFYTEGKLRRSNWKKSRVKDVQSVTPPAPDSTIKHYCCWCGQLDYCIETMIDAYDVCDGCDHEEVVDDE